MFPDQERNRTSCPSHSFSYNSQRYLHLQQLIIQSHYGERGNVREINQNRKILHVLITPPNTRSSGLRARRDSSRILPHLSE